MVWPPQFFYKKSNRGGYSHIISLKDLECNNSLAGSDPKDLSPRKDLGAIIKTRRVQVCTYINLHLLYKPRHHCAFYLEQYMKQVVTRALYSAHLT